MRSEIYKRIRDNIIRTWPAWKRKFYNSCFAVSAHAEKLPEDDRTMSTPVWTNYDRLISKTPEEMAEWLRNVITECSRCPCNETPVLCEKPCKECLFDWLKSPVEVDE